MGLNEWATQQPQTQRVLTELARPPPPFRNGITSPPPLGSGLEPAGGWRIRPARDPPPVGWSGRRAEGPVPQLDPDTNTQQRSNRAKTARARPCGGVAEHSTAWARDLVRGHEARGTRLAVTQKRERETGRADQSRELVPPPSPPRGSHGQAPGQGGTDRDWHVPPPGAVTGDAAAAGPAGPARRTHLQNTSVQTIGWAQGCHSKACGRAEKSSTRGDKGN